MTLSEARMIRELKKRCTYRRLAEIYYPVEDERYGSQSDGEELCEDAFKVLYPNIRQEPKQLTFNLCGEIFRDDNKSYLGDFFWWE